MPDVRSSELLSPTSIRSSLPSKLAAAPNFALVDQVAPLTSVPLLPLPELCAAEVPDPSSKEYAATRPEHCATASEQAQRNTADRPSCMTGWRKTGRNVSCI